MSNRTNSLSIANIVLYGIGIYHVLLGLAGMFLKTSIVDIAKSAFSFNLTMTPELGWIINPFAAYIFVFGLMMILAATDIKKYKYFIWVGVTLFWIRIIQRILFIMYADDALKAVINPTQNIIHLIIVLALGLYLIKIAARD